jgi:DNA-binding MarR family transcriptional regulator
MMFGMEKKSVTRFVVEPTETQVARRPKRANDGAQEIYLTRKQCRVLLYIGRCDREDYHPNYTEVAEACRFRSRQGAMKVVKKVLAEHDLVMTDIRRARSIQLTKEGRKVYQAFEDAIAKKGGKKRISS